MRNPTRDPQPTSPNSKTQLASRRTRCAKRGRRSTHVPKLPPILPADRVHCPHFVNKIVESDQGHQRVQPKGDEFCDRCCAESERIDETESRVNFGDAGWPGVCDMIRRVSSLESRATNGAIGADERVHDAAFIHCARKLWLRTQQEEKAQEQGRAEKEQEEQRTSRRSVGSYRNSTTILPTRNVFKFGLTAKRHQSGR